MSERETDCITTIRTHYHAMRTLNYSPVHPDYSPVHPGLVHSYYKFALLSHGGGVDERFLNTTSTALCSSPQPC